MCNLIWLHFLGQEPASCQTSCSGHRYAPHEMWTLSNFWLCICPVMVSICICSVWTRCPPRCCFKGDWELLTSDFVSSQYYSIVHPPDPIWLGLLCPKQCSYVIHFLNAWFTDNESETMKKNLMIMCCLYFCAGPMKKNEAYMSRIHSSLYIT